MRSMRSDSRAAGVDERSMTPDNRLSMRQRVDELHALRFEHPCRRALDDHGLGETIETG